MLLSFVYIANDNCLMHTRPGPARHTRPKMSWTIHVRQGTHGSKCLAQSRENAGKSGVNESSVMNACAVLVGRTATDVLVSQAARVAGDIARRKRIILDDRVEPDAIVRLFRSAGLIPEEFLRPEGDGPAFQRTIESVFETVRDCLGLTDITTARVCFAACIYPQRAFQVKGLDLRAAAFAAFIKEYSSAASVDEALDRYLDAALDDERWPREDTHELCASLAGEPSAGSEAARCGGALYLGTCHRDLLLRIHGFWRDDRAAVRVFRSYLTHPPSDLVQSSSIQKQIVEEIGEEMWNRARRVENISWKLMQSWPKIFKTNEYFAEAWEGLTQVKLTSQFPYYAFRSRFESWWKQEFLNYRFGPVNASLETHEWHLGDDGHLAVDDDSGDVPESANVHSAWVAKTQGGISIDEMRVYREGYRLVRSTFFDRDDSRNTAKMREALDSIWYFYVDEKLQRKQVRWGALGSLVEGLAAQFKMEPARLFAMYNRLRLRMWAYVLGRTTRCTNSEISRRPRPRGYEASGKPYPLEDVEGVKTVAAVARVSGVDYSLLWGFLAYVLLRVRFVLNPRYTTDAWTFAQFLDELGVWMADETFPATIEYGLKKGRRAETVIVPHLAASPLRELLHEFSHRPAESGVKDSAATHPHQSVKRAFLEIVRELAGPGHFNAPPAEWKKFLGWPGDVATHWVIPVWYLTVVEQMDETAAIDMLRVEPDETSAVRKLARTIRRYADANRIARRGQRER